MGQTHSPFLLGCGYSLPYSLVPKGPELIASMFNPHRLPRKGSPMAGNIYLHFPFLPLNVSRYHTASSQKVRALSRLQPSLAPGAFRRYPEPNMKHLESLESAIKPWSDEMQRSFHMILWASSDFPQNGEAHFLRKARKKTVQVCICEMPQGTINVGGCEGRSFSLVPNTWLYLHSAFKNNKMHLSIQGCNRKHESKHASLL